ncbi:MAG: hypothetical protein ACI9E5_000989 [Candidatus Omnitrophota bacterium]|jgi:hypothetical protein
MITIILLIIGVLLILWGIKDLILAMQSSSWTKVDGVVERCALISIMEN